MTVETVERKLWTCNACGTDEITTGPMPKDWSTKWAWATRYVIPERKDRPKIFDIAIHTCHDCSSGPMYFIVRNLIKHLTDDEWRDFKGERCQAEPECTLPDKHEGNHKFRHSRPDPLMSFVEVVDTRDAPGNDLKPCPILACRLVANHDSRHEDKDGYQFDEPIAHKTDAKPPLHGPGDHPTGPMCAVRRCIAIGSHPGLHEDANGKLFSIADGIDGEDGPHPDCICLETTVGKDGCPVHGHHYAHHLDADGLAKLCPNVDCVMAAHEGVIHTDDDGNEFEHPEVDKSGKPYDDYPGVLSTGDDGEPIEVTYDVDGVCSESFSIPDFSGGQRAHCLRATGHDGKHHDPHTDTEWEQ